MRSDDAQRIRLAVLTMAEIKPTTEAFERGELNIHEAIEAVAVAVEGRGWAGTETRSWQERKWAIERPKVPPSLSTPPFGG